MAQYLLWHGTSSRNPTINYDVFVNVGNRYGETVDCQFQVNTWLQNTQSYLGTGLELRGCGDQRKSVLDGAETHSSTSKSSPSARPNAGMTLP